MKILQPVPKVSESFMDAVIMGIGGRRLSEEELRLIPGANADYIIDTSVVELKVFEEEPLEKKERQDELAAYLTDNFLVPPEVDINIKNLNDEAKHGYREIVGKRIKKAVKKAAKQIRETKSALGRTLDFGVFIAVNNGYSSLPHDEFDNLVLKYSRNETSQIDFIVCVTVEYHAGNWDSYVFCHTECYATRGGFEYPRCSDFKEEIGKRFNDAMTEMMRNLTPNPDLSESLAPVKDIHFERDGVKFVRAAPDADFKMKRYIEEQARKEAERFSADFADNLSAYIEYPDEETYLAFKEVCSDREQMFGQPYSAWLSQGLEVKKEAEAQGVRLVGILATPTEFVAWCEANEMETDSEARAAFASCRLGVQLQETTTAEQGGAAEPATRTDSDSQGSNKPQPGSEERSR